MFLSIGICIAALASMKFISDSLQKAPEGWEDETGFHCIPPVETLVCRPSPRTAAVMRTGSNPSMNPLVLAKRFLPQGR